MSQAACTRACTRTLSAALLVAVMLAGLPVAAQAADKKIAYLSAKRDLPFWSTLGKGIKASAEAKGYAFIELDSALSAETQMKNAQEAINQGVAGLVISPTDSKTAPAVLALAAKARVPVVIADIGSNGGDYVSFVKSDNYRGAYDIGTALAVALKEKGWQAEPHALITISLDRKNGQDRTNGFRDALKDAGMSREVALKQMQDYSAAETQRYVSEILAATPKLRALFIETDQPVQGAMQAIKEARGAKKVGEVLIVSFDAMPEVAALLSSGSLVAVGMQQPYLMGKRAAEALIASLNGERPAKQVLVPILVATRKTIAQLLPVANETVFGLETK